PDDAELPIVQKVDLKSFPVVDVVLSGNLDPRELYEIADKTLKDRFSQIEGVAKVDITGGQEREIRVILDNKVAFENNISLPQLLGILKAYNMDIPGGYFKIRDQEYTVRLKGEYADVATMKNMQVPTPFGPKKLQQFAQVLDAGKDIRQRAVYFDNITKEKDENVVRMGIVKSAEGNVVKVADGIRAALPDIQASLPQGTNLEIVNDESDFVKSSVNDTMSNVYLGVLFTAIVLLIFLHDIRSTIIVALSMPTSIISTFFLLKAFGLSLNMMTLMGLSVSVGVLVANSIVVIENIFRYKSLGKKNKEAAFKGTSEVTVAVLASTLTNLVVFLPIANMSSLVGQWLKELALAAVFATIFSLIMSFTLTPMLASLILPEVKKKGS
ncbi:MAG: efflux RND transporter permease subunit, partial [Ignavibacteriaceae bacterium]